MGRGRYGLIAAVVAAAVCALLAIPGAATAHPERETEFPNGLVEPPTYNSKSTDLIVCKSDSERRIERIYGVQAQDDDSSDDGNTRTRRRSGSRRAPAFTGRSGPTRTGKTSQAVQRKGRSLLRLNDDCKYRHIQAAVNDSESNDRIIVMPGVYKEEPSRKVPFVGPEADTTAPNEGGGLNGGLDIASMAKVLPTSGLRAAISGGRNKSILAAQDNDDPICSSMKEFQEPDDGDPPVPNYKFQLKCPNSRNLIAVIGDTNEDRKCDRRCNLQIEGMGRKATDVLIVGDRIKRDVIRADRADGIYIRNLAAEQAAFNAFDVVETNGFRLNRLEARWNQLYGILTFTSDNGVYQNVEAFGNGDSGIYPGSGPEGHCQRYGIEIKRVYSHDNVLGHSGTAGNGTYVHHSRFEDNNAGISMDSFATGHPGMPQDCSKFSRNVVASNNSNFFTPERQDFCASTSFQERPREIVCPQFQVPVGSGFILYGGNSNEFSDNFIYDNWRSGTRLFYVPAAVRGENDPAKQTDTSNENQYLNNRVGVEPNGTRNPNGVDFFWDEQGEGNCWEGNTGPGDAKPTSDPKTLPDCPGSPLQLPPNPAKSGQEAPCATWDEADNQFPPGCDWFNTPPEPK
ncbi:MAG: hypothetical protein ACR2NA_01245 [Solirubrobacterales bacterium]